LLSALSFLRPPPPPLSPLFPYTTLFRSFCTVPPCVQLRALIRVNPTSSPEPSCPSFPGAPTGPVGPCGPGVPDSWLLAKQRTTRSEEHTSELQPLTNLVSPLLLPQTTTT